jgi:hypothetical protein
MGAQVRLACACWPPVHTSPCWKARGIGPRLEFHSDEQSGSAPNSPFVNKKGVVQFVKRELFGLVAGECAGSRLVAPLGLQQTPAAFPGPVRNGVRLPGARCRQFPLGIAAPDI